MMIFDSSEKNSWINKIIDYSSDFERYIDSEREISLQFGESIDKQSIEPFHIVTLMCLIQKLRDNDLKVYLADKKSPLASYIYDDLQLKAYFSLGQNFVEPKNKSDVLGLWRIKDSEKDLYALKVEEFFRKSHKQKDISAISLILKEAFYNVFDHAKAGNNAFIFSRYQDPIISVAISDFGIGIVNSVKGAYPNISGIDAINKALEYGFTVRSTDRNMGYGLTNMINSTCTTKIYSNEYLVICKKSNNFAPEIFECEKCYPGTLLYFEIDVSDFEDEEIIEEFNF